MAWFCAMPRKLAAVRKLEVASEKAIRRALDHSDVASIRAMAMRVFSDLQPDAAPPWGAVAQKSDPDLQNELQAIEDLLTGKTYAWKDQWNYVALNPNIMPAHIFRVSVLTPRP